MLKKLPRHLFAGEFKLMPPTEDPASKAKERPVSINFALVVLALLLAVVTYFAMPPSMDEASRRMASIFVMALVLWVTEGIPLFATSLLVIISTAWWVAVPEHVANDLDYKAVLDTLGCPIIFLFLGGFILAKAVHEHGIDKQMAALMLRPFGARPYGILAGVMVITAVFSMWMSNTATTAMMMAIVAPLAMQMDEGDPFRRGLVLAVPLAANVGGIGTPIGTPPNAIAMGALDELGLGISFFKWMTFAVPLVVISLVALWILILLVYRPKTKRFDISIDQEFNLTFEAGVVYCTFGITVLLWLSQPLHGVPNAVIAVVPAAVLTMTGIIGRRDFNRLEWDILVLIAGGIALGRGITGTHLDQWFVSHLPLENLSLGMIVAACTVLTVLMSTVISNTVAANIMVPMGLALVVASDNPGNGQIIAVMIAIGASFAMGLPISTPPNAIAYGSGLISSRNIMFIGGLTSAVATIVIITSGPAIVGFILSL
jgi:sodium-dependent dicarboxylate transporter 2/3/5